jgi:ribosomal 50S subunit-recycling heat shock protein
MTRRTNLIRAAACALALGACAAKDKAPEMAAAAPPAAVPPAPTPVVSGTVAESTVTVTATVTAINHKTRSVTLKGADGKSVTFTVGDSVKNLAQVKKGDQVTATYYESLAYDVMPAGSGQRGVAMAEAAGSAQPGEKPAGMGARAITVTAKIKAIDKKQQTVTLKGPQGKMRTVKVKNPANLEKVKVGDLVQITYTEALAIAVEEAPKAPKTTK